MTFLEIVNRVMRRLREDQVTASNDTEYSTLIAEFVSDIHQEVQEAHTWSVLASTTAWDTVAGQLEYDLSALTTDSPAGDVVVGFSRVYQDSYPIVNEEGLNAWLYEDSSATEPKSKLELLRDSYLQSCYYEDLDATDQPSYISFNSSESIVSMYPVPDAVHRVRARFYVPQEEFAVDSTDDTTTVTIPWRPIYLGALYMALNERGEEIGEPGGIAEQRYNNALGSAIDADMRADQLTNRYEAYRD